MWIDFSYFYSFRWDSHKIGGLNFASKATQKPSIFGSKIIYFQNQSLSYSSSINHKARCIKSCWPCIDCFFARRRRIVLRSLCTRRFPVNAKLFCKWKHTSNSFLQSSAPTKNFALPSPLPEREKNKQWTRWAITVHQKFCSAKENITRCNFYAYENLLPNYSREYFAKWKLKRKSA
mgnify:CR=1 FL=1